MKREIRYNFMESFSNEIVINRFGIEDESEKNSFLSGFHMQHALIFLISGSLILHDGHSSEAYAGNDIALIYPNTPVELSAAGSYKYLYFSFDCFIARQIMKKYGQITRIPTCEFTEAFLGDVLSEPHFDTLGFNLKAVAFILSALARLDGSADPSVLPVDRTDFIRFFIDAVEASYGNTDLKVSGICRELGISVPYFTNLFPRQMGCSPRQYIIDTRMQKAKKMLRNSNLTINEIAHYAGYENALYFTSSFKRYAGLTPTAYRRTNHQLNL